MDFPSKTIFHRRITTARIIDQKSGRKRYQKKRCLINYLAMVDGVKNSDASFKCNRETVSRNAMGDISFCLVILSSISSA